MTATKSADFLVELGTEELPPKALLRLRDSFRDGITAGLREARLHHSDIEAFATPRRLAILVHELELTQPVQEIESRGPPVSIAYDDNGKPAKAAVAFAAKYGVTVEQLETIATDKGEWLYFRGTEPGAAAKDLLGDIVAASLAALPIPKRMRWGSSEIEFVRPVHWLVMLLGDEVVDAEILGIKADRITYGHRFLAPEPIDLPSPTDYVDILRQHGRVIVDFAERQSLIKEMARQTAKDLGGEAVLQADVVEEVTALVELPVPVAGSFDSSFLQLPAEVLISTLQDHQRYFPVQCDGSLLPAFITISNLESTNPDEVKRGNERVVLPRLADATFFWEQDSATPLSDRCEKLKTVVYQKGLGSLHDKSQRVAQLAALVAAYVQADDEMVNRAAALARTDLLTAMVGEFPDLQGRMGFYYARNDGEAEAVAVAIEEQYLPRHAGDRLPATPVGMALSIADRLDTLAGIFALGKKPGGNKDPFGLRRQALGLIRILIECRIDVDLPALLRSAVELQPVQNLRKLISLQNSMSLFWIDCAPGISADRHLLLQRVKFHPEIFESVRSRSPASPLDFQERLLAVHHFMSLEAASSLAAANKRIANLLKKTKETSQSCRLTKPCLISRKKKDCIQRLRLCCQTIRQRWRKGITQVYLANWQNYANPIDSYFDQVMVLTDDEKLRANRLAQLGAAS